MFKKHSFFATALFVISFLFLTIGVLTNASVIHYLDNALFNLVALTYSPWLTTIMIYITSIGSPLIVTTLAVVLFILNRHKGRKTLILFSFYFSTSGLALLLKLIIHRQRPSFQLFSDTGLSFPSGHSICMILLLLILFNFLSHRKDIFSTLIKYMASIWTFLLLVSRIYLRDHYPTDILASISLAMASYFFIKTFALDNSADEIASNQGQRVLSQKKL